MQYDGKSIVCAVVIDGYGQQNKERIDSNAITSIHTRQNAVTGLLNDAIENESAGNVAVYYIDAKSHRLTPAGWATIAQAAVSHRWLHT